MPDAPAPYDHFRATATADADPGIYRVVGTSETAVTLLRVADDDGTRRATGDLRRVPLTTLRRDFEPAANPGDGGLGSFVRAITAAVKSAFER